MHFVIERDAFLQKRGVSFWLFAQLIVPLHPEFEI